MTSLITGDIHLNDNPRDRYRHDFIANELPRLLRKSGADRLVILGDLTDEKDRHRAWLVNQIVDHLVALAKIADVDILRANHDYTEVENPFFEFTQHLKNVRWIGKPRVSQVSPTEVFLYLPHTSDYKRDWASLDFNDDINAIFAHQTFQGANVGARKMEGIPTAVFPKNATVISGDIHVPQTFGPITYVGSPYTIDFGDDFEPRVLVLEPRRKPRSVPCPGPQKRLIKYVGSPRSCRVTVEGKYQPGDIVKIRVDVAAADHAEWPSLKKDVRSWAEGRELIVWDIVPNVLDRGKASSAARRKREGAKTDKQLMEQYGRSKNVNDDTLSTGMSFVK